jgi:tetratricopeptide (TPR) repeat protein
MGHKPKKYRPPDSRDPDRCKGTVPGTADRHSSPGEIPLSSPRFWTHNTYAVAVVCGFLLLAVALVFGQTIGHEFVNYDDNRYVYENPVVQKGLTLEGFRWALTYGEIGHWHPLTWFSHMLDCQLYGLHAGGHHLTNVLLHAAASILLFLVLWRMTGFLWRSAFVAAVFAVHPLRAESVAWVAERKDVLSGLFFMLTIGAYVRYVRRPTSMVRYATVVLLFALGLLSKNMLVTLPFVLLLLDYWPLNRVSGFTPRIWLQMVAEKWPLFALAAASCVITFLVPEEVSTGGKLSLTLRMENALVSYVVYLRQMIYPSGLACLYPNPTDHLPFWQVAGALGLLTAVSWAIFAFRRKHPYLVVGWLWYLGMMIPVIGIVQISYYAHADRYTYLPQIGLWIAVTWGVGQLTVFWRHRYWVFGVASTLVLLFLMGIAWRQTSYWRNSEMLWIRALACTAHNNIAHNNLGNTLADRGQVDAAIAHYRKALEIKPDDAVAYYNLGTVLKGRGQVDAAIAHYQKALEIKPDYAEAHNNLGNILKGIGQVDAAIAHYQSALKIKPDDAEAHNNLGVALADRGQIDTAIVHFQRVLEIKPDFAEGHNNLGIALAIRGQIGEASVHFQKALEINPHYANAHYNLGMALDRQGKIADAVIHWREAVQLQPNQINYLNQLAMVLAISPSGAIRNGAEAIDLALRAVRLTDGREPAILGTLAAAYAEAGRFSEAVETAERAVSLAVARGDTALADTLRARIKLYQAGSPYRETRPQASRN